MADGYIGGFDSKYHCNYWRPVTAIRAGGDSDPRRIMLREPFVPNAV
jgi:hypothetical protein